jgi:hypothetical protein
MAVPHIKEEVIIEDQTMKVEEAIEVDMEVGVTAVGVETMKTNGKKRENM